MTGENVRRNLAVTVNELINELRELEPDYNIMPLPTPPEIASIEERLVNLQLEVSQMHTLLLLLSRAIVASVLNPLYSPHG